MRTLHLCIALTAVVASCARGPAAPPAPHRSDPVAAVNRIADEYLAAYLVAFPEDAVYASVDGVRHDRVSDNSPAGIARWRAREDAWLDRLAAIDAGALDGVDRVLHATLVERLEASRATRVCRRELWAAEHLWGWQVRFALVAARQPVGTPAARADALARARAIATYIANERAALDEGLATGHTVPASVMRIVASQIDALLAAPVDESPLFDPGRRDPELAAPLRAVLADEVTPAMREYLAFVRDRYLPRTRTALAVSAIPDGAACYEASLRAFTTLARTGREVHELGQGIVAANRVEIEAVGREWFDTDELAAIVAAIRADPAYALAGGDDVLAFAREVAARAHAALPAWFEELPRAPGVVEPWPAALDSPELGDIYEPPSATTPRGVYRITLTEVRTRASLEVTTLHELAPGHHLQLALEREAGRARHPVLQLLGNAAFVEGWARYAEHLAEEMDLYTLPGSRVVRRAWPARGMVADPGLHLLGWTREQTVAYLQEAGRFADEYVETLPDRMAVWPGQLTAYDTGAAEIVALRRAAEGALGERFDVRAFHSRVLEHGTVPLGLLRHHVEAWIAAERTGR